MRVTTIGVPRFIEGGLTVGDAWSEFDYANADASAQRAFKNYVGRFVRIHPDDVGELAKHGFALDGGRLVEAPAEVQAPAAAIDTGAPVEAPPAAGQAADIDTMTAELEPVEAKSTDTGPKHRGRARP